MIPVERHRLSPVRYVHVLLRAAGHFAWVAVVSVMNAVLLA